MPTINLRGSECYYEWIRTKKSEQKAATKPVMVFVHGWGGSSRYWQSTAHALAEDYDCLLYDLRGFGRSQAQTSTQDNLGYELDTYAEDLNLLLDALELEQVYLHAHSMGSSIATLFLNQYRERVIKAIIACNGIFEYNKAAFAAFHTFGGYVVKFRYNWFLKVPFADQMFMARFLTQPISKSDRIAFLEDFLLADYGAALGTIYTSVSKKAVETMPQEFTDITVPTLLISGEKDQIIPAKMARQASLLNPEYLSYLEIPNTGHFPMLEAEATYLKQIQLFLSLATKKAKETEVGSQL